ncbi:MAG TPA: diaminopimelate dehydrogenase [Thermoanaerobacterales bacterium]|nr:diaminopimelate dehydrogenase [Thermoanaerobacterales bacterium]
MQKLKIAVVGFGNVGRGSVDAVKASPDMELVGVVLRNKTKIQRVQSVLNDVPVVTDFRQLEKPDVAILAIPSRSVPKVAAQYLNNGISTIDCFDIHGDAIIELRDDLDIIAKQNECVAVISAGWDPGTDSMIRTILEIVTPRGLTFTNYGPGMSMGHTVVVKAIDGVEDAISLTIPQGTGIHRRLVYVKIKDGFDFDKIAEAVKKDPYFVNDETHVVKVEDIKSLIDVGHGVHMERKGVAGITHNQIIEFTMSVTNPAATGQIMASAARAAKKQAPGCYSLPEIPPIDFIHGDKRNLLKKLI